MDQTRELGETDGKSPAASDGCRRAVNLTASVLLFAAAAFVAYGSLVPFDFQFTGAGSAGRQFLTPFQSRQQVRSLSDWATNIAVYVPLGFFGFAVLGQTPTQTKKAWHALATLAGCFIFSLGIEFAQTFFPPRNPSVFDVIANTAGAAIGIVGWIVLGDGATHCHVVLRSLHAAHRSPRVSEGMAVIVLGGCALLIAAWAGFFTAGWTGWTGAVARFEDLPLPPFVQHQAAEIRLALVSAVFAVLAYAPLGTALWLLDICPAKPVHGRLLVAASIAAGIALLVEAGKLFLVAKSPDTGNVVVAGVAAALGYVIAPLFARPRAAFWVLTADADGRGAPTAVVTRSAGLLVGRFFALVSGFAVCALVATYPMGRVQFGIALVAYGAILARYPIAWLIAVPALLPVLDLAPWTGRFFFDEFDGLVLVTLAVGLWRAAGRPLESVSGRWSWLLVGGFTASFVASTVVGLLPLQPWDANALASHYSHYAALRLAKGLVFAMGLAALVSSHAAAGHDVQRVFGVGMRLGLAAASASVICERLAYPGLTDFVQDFRVVGLFSTMHTGGAHLDAYLLTTLPFAAAWALSSRRATNRVAGALLFAVGAYAIMMTFSRAAVAALAISILVTGALSTLSGRRAAGRALSGGAKATVGLALAGLVIVPVLLGNYMQSRLATTEADLEIRTVHWNEAIGLMTDKLGTTLFGMGLGRYPETYLLLGGEGGKPAIHRFEVEGTNRFLRIGHGATLYVEQIVDVEPQRDYRITMKARGAGHGAAVNVLLCDRTFLQGFGCQAVTFQLTNQVGEWQQLQATINSASVGERRMRTVKLSLENAGSESAVDIDDVALIGPDGTDRLVNGSFQAGADRWYFSSPFNHLSWHIKNLWIEILFEQGWVGLLLFCALMAVTVARLAALVLRGNDDVVALLSAVIGFLTVSAFDSVFDAPRLTLLFGLLVAVSGFIYARPQTIVVDRLASIDASGRRAVDVTGTGHPPTVAAFATSGPNSAPAAWIRSAGGCRIAAFEVFVGIVLLAVSIAIVTRLSFVPYNVHLLANPYHPWIAPLLLATLCFWTFGLPAVIARWLGVAHRGGATYPLVVAFHALIGWGLVHLAVLPDAVHKVIGYPILGWPWEAENIARFVTLYSVVSIQLTAGALLATVLTGTKMIMAVVRWLLTAVLLLPIQYWVIVNQAATDNLTELMAGNASASAFLLLTSYVMVVGTTGAMLASIRAGGSNRWRVAISLAALVVSLPVGYLLLTAGTEAVTIKYGKVFSGLQFILSSDREHYAVAPELWIRFSVAHLAAVGVTALAQVPLWPLLQERFRRRGVSADGQCG